MKLGPFHSEVITTDPFRSFFHNVFHQDELDFMIEYSTPRLTQLRELEAAANLFKLNDTESRKNKRRFVQKTIQTWFNDTSDSKIAKLTQRLELATQLNIKLTEFSSTDYQVTHYGLGGLCETHIDPYGYLEGAELYEAPAVQRLKQSGDMLGTLMGYLNNVEAGGVYLFF